ncbi:MAG: hypothetical protein L0Y60_00995 [Beijerinckiaceae bacterium]|nr:hypothetical protein [Beijerinckiaceae bacterium]
MAILEEPVLSEVRLSPADLLTEVQRLGLHTPSESAAMIRAGRDAG